MQAPGHSSLFPLARLLLFLWALLAGRAATAQEEDFHHPELTWKTIETAHFLVHYHEGAERTARVVAKVAEEIYEPVTSLYEHTPDQRVSLIIRDVDDIANGAAYFYDNKIELFAPSMDFELRGTHNWLRNVVAHEFTHIVQIQTAMKFGRTVPAFYLQWLNYESERRPDVLYGYPNVIASYPISGFVVPAWFAEGVAQYNRKELRYDFWDSHRDMILRSYALDGNLLSWDQMGVFGKTSLGNESSYNAGFAFVSYIARRYGEEKLLEISRNLSRLTETTIDGAIRRAVGKDGRELYDEWRQAITGEYRRRIAPVRAALREGTRLVFDSSAAVVDPGQIESNVTMHRLPWGGSGHRGGAQLPCCSFGAAVGFANLYPSYSPDGTKLAYTSTKGADYFSLSALYVYDFSSRKESLVQPGVRTALAWSPDGAKLYYAKNTRDNPHWSLQFDLYEYDLRAQKEKRITRGRRAMSPSVSPGGDRLVCVVTSDGTSNLALANVDGSDFHLLTHYEAGEQVYNPRWSPAGDQIVFDFSVKDGRDIALIRPDGSGLRYLLQGPEDTRSAVFTQDGKGIVYSSDRTGVFNLYYYELSSGGGRQLTNVTGGAFLPTVAGSGAVVYALYTSGGYKLFRLDSLGGIPSGSVEYERSDPPSPPAGGTGTASADGGRFDWPSLRTYDDTKLPPLSSTPYRPRFTSLGVVPFLRVDNYNARSKGIDLVKPGVYLFSNEILDKTGFFASASLNLRLERDLYLQFAYRGKIPLFYQLGLEPVATAELFNVTRKTQSTLSLPASTIPVDLTYDLMEFDFALRQPALSQFSAVELRYAHSRYASVIENFINPETTPPTLVSGSRELYLIANTFTLTFEHDAVIPSRTSEINPVGRKVMLRLSRELNKFNGDGEYEITSIGLQPRYKTVNFTRAELRWREHFALPFGGHTLTALLHGGAILGPEVDEFFDFYAGGLVGMRGYPFYALGGNRMAVAALHYRFPLVQNMDFRVLSIYFDKLYASVFADVGNAWSERRVPSLSVFKKDIGAELRLESFSFYAYPTRFFLSAAYGFDRFDRYISRLDQTVTYGKEWRFYFGVLFGFDLD
jgi:hypothetical protein